MEATMDETGATLPTDDHTTESAAVADVSTVPSPGQLTPEHVCMEDIGTQLINIESLQPTIGMQVWKLENKPTETTVSNLKSLLPSPDGLQSSSRATFAAHARPSIRRLHIFQLPDELLMKISEDVRGDLVFEDDEYSIAGIKGIENLRLTCRRFCDTSSHLLLHRLDLALTSSSIKHLDEVSRHPTVSKGIRSLQIFAALYHPGPASDLQSFTTEALRIMRGAHQSDLDYLRDYADQFDTGESNRPSPEDHGYLCKIVDDLGKREKIIQSYTNFLRTETSESDEDQNMAILRQAYKVYERLFKDQIALLQNGTFAANVAKAVARMPMVAGLSVTDQSAPRLRLPSTEMSGPVYDSVRESLFRSRPWDRKLVSLLPQRPVKLLYQLPSSLIRAGNRLTELTICLNPIPDHKLKLSEWRLKDLVSAAEHLKILEINCGLITRAVQSGGQARVSSLVSLFLSGKNLRSVALRFQTWPNFLTGARSSLEPLLALLPWVNLEGISLVNGYFEYDELSKHFEKLKPGTYIHMGRVHLMSGLWADLLDVLRLKADCDSIVRQCTGNDDEQLDFTYQDNFVAWNALPNPATAYIRGQITDNPLRSLPDQDIVDTEDMDEED